jgi:hypothetical protein
MDHQDGVRSALTGCRNTPDDKFAVIKRTALLTSGPSSGTDALRLAMMSNFLSSWISEESDENCEDATMR